MVDYTKLWVRYKYTKTMQIERNTAHHVFERWKVKHLEQFLEDGIEFHVSPEYTYEGTHYYQLTLDLDLERFHKVEGGTLEDLKSDIKKIIKRLSGIPFHIEFTGNGYRVVSDVAWKDFNLDKIRDLAKQHKSELPSVDWVSSYRRMPIARIGTHDKGRRLIVLVNKSDADNFNKYKSLSKKKPLDLMDKDKWFKLFEKLWFPDKYLSSGGMEVIKKLYNIKE